MALVFSDTDFGSGSYMFLKEIKKERKISTQWTYLYSYKLISQR
jgi:hypothetical protein